MNNYKKYIILGVVFIFIVGSLIIYGVQDNKDIKHNEQLRNFATEEMNEDFTNVYADVVSIEPKHYVYKYATNRTGLKLNDGDLTQIVCECETIEGETIWVSFLYWECPAYNSFGDSKGVTYSVDAPLRIMGNVNIPSQIAEDLGDAIGDRFVLFSEKTQKVS